MTGYVWLRGVGELLVQRGEAGARGEHAHVLEM